MRIRHPLLIKSLGLAASFAFRSWMNTIQFRFNSFVPYLDPRRKDCSKRYCYVTWHENIMLGVYQCRRTDFCVIVSQHADGELIAEIARHLRLKTIRGSSTRGGVEAVRKIIRLGRRKHLGIMVDGPRGPRRRVQPGLIALAGRTGLPVVPTGFGYREAWRLDSWDRFVIPKPYSLATCVTGTPIVIPPNFERTQIEHFRQNIEAEIGYVNDLAETWAETGKLVLPQTTLKLAG